MELDEVSEDYDYVQKEDYSDKWYATAPVVKYFYRYLMRGCTSKPVFHPIVEVEEHDEYEISEEYMKSTSSLEGSEVEKKKNKKNKKGDEVVEFTTSFGIFFSCIGSVVGSGNIWRFPRICAQNSFSEGSLAFLIVWIFSLFLWSIPIIIVEFTVGRFTKTGPLNTFAKFLGPKLYFIGGWTVFIAFLISCYYNVIVGWCLYYVYYTCATESLPLNETESIAIFNDFTQNSYVPLICHTCSLIIVGICVFGGLAWIEWVNSALVTLLGIIIIITFGWALSLDHADVGIQFLFSPKWESLANPNLWIDAFIQNAFDTGAGLGHYAVYSGFFRRTDKSIAYAVCLPMLNNLVSLVCGISIFSTVFATMIATRPTLSVTAIKELMKESGPGSTGLTFTWIPVLYQTMGVAGRVLCALFFICLSFAGLTTQISNLQLTTVTLQNCGVNHYLATGVSLLVTFLLGIPSAIFIMFLTNQDFVWGFALIISGVLFCSIPLSYGVERFRKRIVNEFGINDWHLIPVWSFLLVFLIPILATVFIIWWAVGLLADNPEWNSLGATSFFTVILEWLGLLVFLLLLNLLIVKCGWNIMGSETDRGYDPYHLELVDEWNPDSNVLEVDEDENVKAMEVL